MGKMIDDLVEYIKAVEKVKANKQFRSWGVLALHSEMVRPMGIVSELEELKRLEDLGYIVRTKPVMGDSDDFVAEVVKEKSNIYYADFDKLISYYPPKTFEGYPLTKHVSRAEMGQKVIQIYPNFENKILTLTEKRGYDTIALTEAGDEVVLPVDTIVAVVE